MTGYIVYNKFLRIPKYLETIKLFIDAFDKVGLKVSTIANGDITLKLSQGMSFDGILPSASFVLFWDRDVNLATCLEMCGYTVFNKADAIRICNDRTLTQMVLNKNLVSTPPCVIAPSTINNIPRSSFEFLAKASDFLGYPFVLKIDCLSSGNGVFLVQNESEAKSLLQKYISNNILFQKYIAESKGKITRHFVVGGKVVASVERFNFADFRSTSFLGGNIRNHILTHEELDLSLMACKAINADFACVDILHSKSGALVCNVDTNFNTGKPSELCGVNIANKIAKHIYLKINANEQ